MNNEERESLLTCASELVHLHFLYAGLNSTISNERHDQLCEETALEIFNRVDGKVNDEFTAIESQSTRDEQEEAA